MSLRNLDNLVKTGQLKIEPFNHQEFSGLFISGKTRLKDALNETLSVESRFDLAYNAAHAFALAALRWHGYRSNNRFIVFQVLPHTLGVENEVWRILAKCHELRNLAEYEGDLEIDNCLLNDLQNSVQILMNHLTSLNKICDENEIEHSK